MISEVFKISTQVIAVVNQKGGVAKTTVCRTLGAMLRRNGYRVLLMDMDAQQTLGFSLGAVADRFDEETPSIYHLLHGEVNVEDAIIKGEDYDLIRSDYRLYGFERTPLVSLEDAEDLLKDPMKLYDHVSKNYARQQDPETNDQHLLRRVMKPLIDSDAYDYILVDTNPNLNDISLSVLTMAPLVKILIPAFPEESSRQSVIALNDTIKTLLRNDLSQRIEIVGILLSKVEKNNITKNYIKYFEKLAYIMETVLFDARIPKSIAVSEAMALKQTVFDRKKTPIMEAYQCFYDQFLTLTKE